MMEEDAVLIFSANRFFQDLVLTFQLSIDYGNDTQEEEVDNASNIESNERVLQPHTGEDDPAYTQEGDRAAEAGGTVLGTPLSSGDATADSGGDGVEQSCLNFTFKQDYRQRSRTVRGQER